MAARHVLADTPLRQFLTEALIPYESDNITRLIIDICGGEAGPMDDQVLALPENRPVPMRVARASKVIGQ